MTPNLAMPVTQIIDAVEIYHKPAQQFISLRFLVNSVLTRDTQQSDRDSVNSRFYKIQRRLTKKHFLFVYYPFTKSASYIPKASAHET